MHTQRTAFQPHNRKVNFPSPVPVQSQSLLPPIHHLLPRRLAPRPPPRGEVQQYVRYKYPSFTSTVKVQYSPLRHMYVQYHPAPVRASSSAKVQYRQALYNTSPSAASALVWVVGSGSSGPCTLRYSAGTKLVGDRYWGVTRGKALYNTIAVGWLVILLTLVRVLAVDRPCPSSSYSSREA